MIPITRELAREIRSNTMDIDTYLMENNISTLRSNATNMLLEGQTSIEEVYALLND
jgi:type IV pilus assembly protein PilB